MNEGCVWRVHGFKRKWVDYLEVSIVVEHTCMMDELERSQRNITSGFVANVIYTQIVDNLNYEPGSIIRQIEEEYKYTISYNKTLRA